MRIDDKGAFSTAPEPVSAEKLRVQALRDALQAFITWGNSQCPCKNEEPDPCPLCGAGVANLEPCKAIESKFPRRLIGDAMHALAMQEPAPTLQERLAEESRKWRESLGIAMQEPQP